MRQEILLIIFIVLLVFMCACQQTPEDMIDIEKDSKALLNQINDNQEDTTQYQAPAKWVETFELSGGKVKVSMDAPIRIPNDSQFPVVRVESDVFSYEDFKSVEQYLFPMCDYYEQKTPGINNNSTKEELEQSILQIQKLLADPNLGLDVKLSEDERRKEIKRLEERIEELKLMIPQASESQSIKPLILSSEFLKQNGLFAFAREKETNKNIGQVSIMANDTDYKYFNQMMFNVFSNPYTVLGNCADGSEEEYVNANIMPELTISKQDAIKIAQEMIDELGLDSFQINKTYKTNFEWYDICFTRTYNDIPTTYTNDQIAVEQSISNPWRYESLVISVGEYGVKSFCWISPTKEAEVVNNSVQLLSYEKIKENAKQLINVRYAWSEKTPAAEYFIESQVQITEIELGLMRVKQSNDTYLMLPVWDFYGEVMDCYSKEAVEYFGGNEDSLDENGLYSQKKIGNGEYRSLLTINAIDGSIIDRSLGY